MQTSTRQAIDCAGGATALAKALCDVSGRQITRQAISQWDMVPAEWCLLVERVTGVSRYELRPDVYGRPGQDAGQEFKRESLPAA
jgi:DNA-binding transcriptional regulator YdaS (Cro superfamily)